MASHATNGNGTPSTVIRNPIEGTFTVKDGLAKMLKGGVIMDVINAEQARIAEEAGACAVMVWKEKSHTSRASTPTCTPLFSPPLVHALVHQCKELVLLSCASTRPSTSPRVLLWSSTCFARAFVFD